MSWYKIHKDSSARDDKEEQADFFYQAISDIINEAMIDGGEAIKLIDSLMSKLRGEKEYRNLLPPSVSEALLKLLSEAKKVKKDSPQKCCAFLEEALEYL